MFNDINSLIDRMTSWIGERVKWLTSLLVLLIFSDALLRYLFSTSKAWLTDLEWHVFALIFLFAAGYALKADQHVRVDVFYSKWSDRRKAWVNLIGTIAFLLPWCLIVIYTSFHYAEHAFLVGERSSESGGLPGRYLIKGAIAMGFLVLLFQSVSLSITSLRTVSVTESPV